MAAAQDPVAYLELVDWRRRVGDLYRLSGADATEQFRGARDRLFAKHPQSPLPEAHRASFTGLRYFDPDPAYRVSARLLEPNADLEPVIEIDTGGEDGVITYRRAARVEFEIAGTACSMTVLSIVGYAGGLFLPFRDATSGKQTYGGGRYLFDTVKNTDGLCLETVPGSTWVTLDFNYAYNPSCAYNHLWACPLAPVENWLSVPVPAGEQGYEAPA